LFVVTYGIDSTQDELSEFAMRIKFSDLNKKHGMPGKEEQYCE